MAKELCCGDSCSFTFLRKRAEGLVSDYPRLFWMADRYLLRKYEYDYFGLTGAYCEKVLLHASVIWAIKFSQPIGRSSFDRGIGGIQKRRSQLEGLLIPSLFRGHRLGHVSGRKVIGTNNTALGKTSVRHAVGNGDSGDQWRQEW